MDKLYKGNLKILIDQLERINQILYDKDPSQRPKNGREYDKIDQAIAALSTIKQEPFSENIPLSTHYQIHPSFLKISLNELYDFNAMGYEYICSVVEAVIKCNGVKNVLDGYATPLYFRGEHKFGWDLKPRLGRKLAIDWSKTDHTKVTDQEKYFLKEFQNRCVIDLELKNKIFGNRNDIIDKNHVGWW
jgi:hypothetical protein